MRHLAPLLWILAVALVGPLGCGDEPDGPACGDPRPARGCTELLAELDGGEAVEVLVYFRGDTTQEVDDNAMRVEAALDADGVAYSVVERMPTLGFLRVWTHRDGIAALCAHDQVEAVGEDTLLCPSAGS